MKARVKATGEIVKVIRNSAFDKETLYTAGGGAYKISELDFDVTDKDVAYNKGYADGFDDAVKSEIDKVKPKIKDVKEKSFPKDEDYWTRLEHQYAGIAMQGMLNNSYLAGEFRKDPNNGIEDMSKIITKAAAVYAHALVEKLKSSDL